jgi:hypothetical protein
MFNINAIYIGFEIQTKTVLLPNGVKIGSGMFTDNLSLQRDDLPFFFGKSLQQKFSNRDISDEAEPLTVFSLGIW